ncbi:HypC/HybG/HupF family hydrogenase formation chaperone [Mycobacterium avium]|uniref:Hydrogenase assembly protein HupF n=1 Tax=Mycolicibacterium agri TaxID=36811 RepID=A0A2A7MQS8_MYCAG|nr:MULTISPECIES: HypC/HybG/HupF family hydrogenase formation chaperone [Mycobacteriaceae]MBN3459530.1 HypC/HybG/HupF family hydrogenase formation chaperone [Mycobacterium sp. DSM 3803]MCA2239290.1 HypC/HybG/HupF family hydrogenase formation chaperone [Mycobacterium avium]MCA2259718.1 HypC/HybG/HupF family hydrogenase formation chaperone [Mycobacterium avium]MCA2281012.1 HypC/HybG/HupF family hydrogenase formation chaperone [Mycobacterium avium]MCA2290571.1 HypC/HybG/HupF family hydrogenase for
MTTTATDPLIDRGLACDLARAAMALAQRFSAGATMWCIAPRWSPHAQHIAVEFVHPVIVGKRALPAVALTDTDLVSNARVSVRAGDVVIAVADADDKDVDAIMRRAPAWGVTTIWIGNGGRPQDGTADHVLWLENPDPRTPATGQFVLIYHLLWELTHVCFEHPGLLTPIVSQCTDEVCITCSDEGRLGEVVRPAGDGTARVRTATGTETVSTVLTEPHAPGDLVLVHAGMAIARIGEERQP